MYVGKEESETSVLGKFVSSKGINIRNCKDVMMHSWGCTDL